MRATLGTSELIVTTIDRGDQPAVLDAPPVATVTAASGATLPPITGVASVTVPNAWEFDLTTTHTADLDHLVLTIEGEALTVPVSTVVTVDVVTSRMFTLADLRAMPDLENTDRYPTALLVRARDWIEDLIESVCGASFCERRHFERYTAGGSIVLNRAWPIMVNSVSVDGEVVTGSTLTPTGVLAILACGDVATVDYVAGYSTHPPADLADAALVAARSRVLSRGQSGIPDRSRGMSNEFGNITFSVAGANAPTGFPDVDAVILRWAERVRIPGIA